MTRKIHTMLALAASATIGAGILMAADPQSQAPGNSHGAREAIDPKAPGANATADQAISADRQISTQLAAIGEDPATAPDKLFVLNTSLDNMCEVTMSQTAQARSSNPQVQQLAAHMTADHTALGQKLQQTAQEMGMQLPQNLPTMKNQESQIFASLSGKALDRQYLASMNASHAKAIACFEGASTLSQNPRVRQLAAETLPVLHEHRRMVQQVASAEGINFHQAEDAMPAAAQLRGTNDNPTNDLTGNTPAGINNAQPPVVTTPGGSGQPVHTTDKNGR